MTAISKFELDYHANLVKMQLTTDPTDWYNKTKLPEMRCHKFEFAEPPDPKKTSVFVTPGKSHYGNVSKKKFEYLHQLLNSFLRLGVKSKVAYFCPLKPIFGLAKIKTVIFKYFGHY
jgi:hypothetical protein